MRWKIFKNLVGESRFFWTTLWVLLNPVSTRGDNF